MKIALRKILDEIREGIFLYGLTGSRDGERSCVNQLMNEWVNVNPERVKYVVGNSVDFHSPLVLREWGYKASDLLVSLDPNESFNL